MAAGWTGEAMTAAISTWCCGGPGLQEIPFASLAGFSDAVRDSNIPFPVEARDWARLPKNFRREIAREHVRFRG